MCADMEAPKPNGERWDFTRPEDVSEWTKTLEHEDPYMLVGSPPRATFAMAKAKEIEDKHLEIACKSYRQQIARGKYFMHELPSDDGSWRDEQIQSLLRTNGVQRVDGPMCKYTVPAATGSRYVRKHVSYMTNLPALADALRKGQ